MKDLTKADINKVLKDIMAGKTAVSGKTNKLRGKAIVRGGAGTATRTVGLLGGILIYAVDASIITFNPAHGRRKPKDTRSSDSVMSSPGLCSLPPQQAQAARLG